MTHWRSMIQLRLESTQEGRRELVLDGVKESRGRWLLLLLLLGSGTYVLLMLIVTVMTFLFA